MNLNEFNFVYIKMLDTSLNLLIDSLLPIITFPFLWHSSSLLEKKGMKWPRLYTILDRQKHYENRKVYVSFSCDCIQERD